MKVNNKYIDTQLNVAATSKFGSGLTLLRLVADIELPPMHPGQFVNVQAPSSAGVLLRRPISICDACPESGEVTILVKDLGRGSYAIGQCKQGDTLNVILPLGNGFTINPDTDRQPLLIGGGVGIAPLLFLGKILNQKGITPEFLLGGRTHTDIPLTEEFEKYGTVHIATEDGSAGHKGLITMHPRYEKSADKIYCCGPLPMMKAIDDRARMSSIPCEVSLENKMACGLVA